MVPDSSGGARSIQLSYSPKIDITLHDTTFNSYQLAVISDHFFPWVEIPTIR